MISLRVMVVALGLFAATSNAATDVIADLHAWLAKPRAQRDDITNASFAVKPLTRAEADAATEALWRDHSTYIRESRAEELSKKLIRLNGLEMKLDWLDFPGTNGAPKDGRALFISMHGGGGAPKAVNDSQWRNQVRLGNGYKPAEGLWVAPRAPTDTWNLWHQGHIDAFFDRIIENFVMFSNVNPNRVYLLGYSAGGDGVFQLGPRMADRWAAASMMAGHPNEGSPLGLRNVPFSIQVGDNDRAYKRNEVAAEWGRRLDALQQQDPTGYVHFTEIHEGKPHWMGLADRKAIPWMEQYTRDALPKKIVWHQDDVTHTQLYWLARPPSEVKGGQTVLAQREGQIITLTATNANAVTLLLKDSMLDLAKPVTVRSGSRELFSGTVPRTIATIARTLTQRGDTNLTFSGQITVTLPRAIAAAAQSTAEKSDL